MEHVLIIVIPAYAQINVTKRTYLLVIEGSGWFWFRFRKNESKTDFNTIRKKEKIYFIF